MSARGAAARLAGTVVEIHGIKATVLLHADGRRLRCRPHRSRDLLAVGDRVVVEEGRHGPEVVTIAPRERCLWRRTARGDRAMAAHVDRVLALAAVVPAPSPGLLDRFLVAAELEGIDAVVVLNKVDLPGVEEARESLAPYAALGYPLLETSAVTGEGLDALRALLEHGLSVVAGHSGVGKSSVLNALLPGVELRTGDVSDATGRGRHTTTVSTSHALGAPWPDGGLVVDTPGVRAFGLHGLPLGELARGFREVALRAAGCRFRDCLHEDEPGCAVREAAAEGAIDPGRYASYRRMLASVRAGEG